MIKSLRFYFVPLFPLMFLSGSLLYLAVSNDTINWADPFYPFGIVLTALYFYFFQNQFVIDLSSKWDRRIHYFSFFAITTLPILQFAKSRELSWVFLAYLPFYFELTKHLENEAKWVKEKKTMLLQFFLVSSFLILVDAIHYWQNPKFSREMGNILNQFSMAVFLIPLLLELKNRELERHNKLSRKFKFENHENNKDNLESLSFTGSLKEQKFFYHDLINKTHGMNLYLSEKLHHGNQHTGLNYQDLVLLQKEIHSLQTMIKDHAEINHRNLAPIREWMSFLEFRPKISYLVRTYFSHKEVILQENYPRIEGEPRTFMVHSPSFERALGNLFKNAYEAESSKIEISINITGRELVFEMKNDLKKIPETSFQLADKLGRNIKRGDYEEAPLGLESIQFLIERMNGKFSFGKEGEYWVSKLVIPNTKAENLERGRVPKVNATDDKKRVA